MNVPNHEKKAFRDMTPEERSGIVEAWLSGGVEYYSQDGNEWREKADGGLYSDTSYRTRPRKLVIPWEHIKPEYKWAAMDADGTVAIFHDKPYMDEGDWIGSVCAVVHEILNIDTTGIDWRESLTARPEVV